MFYALPIWMINILVVMISMKMVNVKPGVLVKEDLIQWKTQAYSEDKELPLLSMGVKPTTFCLVLLMLCHWLTGDLLQARQRHNNFFCKLGQSVCTSSKMLDRCLLLYISYYWLPWENNAFKFNSKNFLAFKLKCFASY